MQLKERYERSFAYWQDKNDGGWEDWFDADITSDLAWPAEAEFCDDLIAEMLNAGETYWGHVGWIRDLWRLLQLWAEEERLIRIRLYAEWLASTLPSQPIDSEIGWKLAQIACGEFGLLERESWTAAISQ